MEATLTFLGTGTSMGVPTLGCDCAVCTSAVSPDGDPRNRRTRPSIRLDYNNHTVLVDTGPDFHAQAIRENIRHVDAVLYTHGHADHVLGFDDLRPLSFRHSHHLPIYADDHTAKTLERIFEYTFRKKTAIPPAHASKSIASTRLRAQASTSSEHVFAESLSPTAASRSPATASATQPT
ncbi:phosphoribosyl 1,2-cyclic phosphodiesterase [Tunturiibacter psychrotolerans]|uniref:MBL fold metallo-hydrolase n=1 Tax=Tunturiibacter psychrotolerans TaxID=3069686 RepID=UPI003D9ACEC1